MIRYFDQNDFSACSEIVNKVWNFDERFKPQQLSDLFKVVYATHSFSVSNFAIVVEENEMIKGFLFGRCANHSIAKIKYSGVIDNLKFVIKLILLKKIRLNQKLFYLKIIIDHEKNRRKVKIHRHNEVNLFAVDPNSQGKGYGKILMNSFIDFCRNKNVNKITLDTDQECNFGFYDHIGFKVKGTFYSPLQKEYSGKSGICYVYQLKL